VVLCWWVPSSNTSKAKGSTAWKRALVRDLAARARGGAAACRRMKIVANAFGERPVLKLMYASLIRGSEHWRGLRVGPFELKQLDALRAELDEIRRRRVTPKATRSDEVPPSRIGGKKGT
jgi:hypothetical protein